MRKLYIEITLFEFNSLESGMNQRCTDPPAFRHDVMRSVKMEERKWSGLQDYSVDCRSLAARLDTLSNCASLVTCDRRLQDHIGFDAIVSPERLK